MSFLPCSHCLGFFKGDVLWRHGQRRPHKCKDGAKKYERIQQDVKLLLPFFDVDQTLHCEVLSKMKNDEISEIVRKNDLIVKFGAANYEKVGRKNANYVSQRMRQLARLMQILRSKSNSEACLQDYMDTSKFDELVLGVKDLCQFQKEAEIGIPSLALKLGHSLKRCVKVLKSTSLRAKDEALIKETKRFLDLFEAEWTNEISSRSLATLGNRKQNKPEYLPLAEDLTVLRKHLDSKIGHLLRCLKDDKASDAGCELWKNLAKATLARIRIFNKRRSGEMEALQIAQFEARPNWAHCSDALKESLTALECHLCER